jgi:iron complex transport system permease protein
MVELSRPTFVLIALGALALVATIAFMTLGVQGNWGFVLGFRGRKLLALVLVAWCVATSTVLFQTITNNRILTPSIMGFDALYVLIKTGIVFFLGVGALVGIDPRLQFGFELFAMVLFSMLLFRWLFLGEERGLILVVLVGIVFGIFFRSLSSFMQRLLDPGAFNVLQDTLFASFATVDPTLLGVSVVVVTVVSLIGLRMLDTFDVLALGRAHAINLGIEYRRVVLVILGMIAVLVSVSTALVGPVTFFGLLVVTLAHALVGDSRHRFVLPASVLIGIVALVGGQALLERVFAFDTALAIIIEFLGGIVFITLVLRKAAR